MRDRDPFRLSGRSRRVGHIGKMRRRGTADRTVATGLPLGNCGIDAEDSCLDDRERRRQRLLRQQDWHVRIVQHERESFARTRGIQRQVRPTGFQDRQQGDDHLDRPLEQDTHQDIRRYAERREVVRQSVGALAQLPIRHVGVAVRYGHRVWRGLRSSLEELVDARVARIRRVGLIPLDEDLPPLLFRENG